MLHIKCGGRTTCEPKVINSCAQSGEMLKHKVNALNNNC